MNILDANARFYLDDLVWGGSCMLHAYLLKHMVIQYYTAGAVLIEALAQATWMQTIYGYSQILGYRHWHIGSYFVAQ